MNREELYKNFTDKMQKLTIITNAEMETRKKCCSDDYKQGIYFLYNKDKIIYVGKVGSGKNTSLYHRIKGHGGGAHIKKTWYKEVEYGRFCKLEKLNETQIEILERICIQLNPNTSNYNDIEITSEGLDEINSLL